MTDLNQQKKDWQKETDEQGAPDRSMVAVVLKGQIDSKKRGENQSDAHRKDKPFQCLRGMRMRPRCRLGSLYGGGLLCLIWRRLFSARRSGESLVFVNLRQSFNPRRGSIRTAGTGLVQAKGLQAAAERKKEDTGRKENAQIKMEFTNAVHGK